MIFWTIKKLKTLSFQSIVISELFIL